MQFSFVEFGVLDFVAMDPVMRPRRGGSGKEGHCESGADQSATSHDREHSFFLLPLKREPGPKGPDTGAQRQGKRWQYDEKLSATADSFRVAQKAQMWQWNFSCDSAAFFGVA
jgi:hypothetical protein